MIIGPHRYTGGIQRYIDQQFEHINKSEWELDVYDVEAVAGSGMERSIVAVSETLYDFVKFPFRKRPDILHVHTAHRLSFYRSAFYVLFAAQIWRIPVVLHIHGSSYDEFSRTKSKLSRFIQTTVYSNSDSIIVLSDGWKDKLSNIIPEDKMTAINNAVDPSKYAGKCGNSPHIVFVSHLIERKGVIELCDAIDCLSKRGLNPNITIAGDGELASDIQELSDVHRNVDYLGYISEKEKRELLSEGTIFVFPTHAEGLPIALLEAMAAENAIITTPVGAIPEIIDDRGGRIVPVSDSQALANKLESLIKNKELTKSMGEYNRDKVGDEYNWATVSNKLEELYDDLVSESK